MVLVTSTQPASVTLGNNSDPNFESCPLAGTIQDDCDISGPGKSCTGPPAGLNSENATVAFAGPGFTIANPVFLNSARGYSLGKTSVDWAHTAPGSPMRHARIPIASFITPPGAAYPTGTPTGFKRSIRVARLSSRCYHMKMADFISTQLGRSMF